jgi:hypothetical protein
VPGRSPWGLRAMFSEDSQPHSFGMMVLLGAPCVSWTGRFCSYKYIHFRVQLLRALDRQAHGHGGRRDHASSRGAR